MPCMVSSCQAKFFVTLRSVAHAANKGISSRVTWSQKFKNVTAKSGGGRLGEVVVLRAVLIIVKGLNPGVIS